MIVYWCAERIIDLKGYATTKMFRKKQGYRLNTLIRGGDKMLQWISALPDNVVNNIFTTINTLICGLIVAFFTSTFLKKKEERTRI